MHVYLVRHAFPLNPTDPDPPLAAKGVEQATMLGQLFSALQLEPTSTKIVSSHFQRAYQTAQHVGERLGISDNQVIVWPTESDWMPINDFTTRFIKLLGRIAKEEEPSEVIVVGHFDYLNKTLAWVIGHDAASLPDVYGATASLTCASSFEKGTGVLGWLVVPYPVAQS